MRFGEVRQVPAWQSATRAGVCIYGPESTTRPGRDYPRNAMRRACSALYSGEPSIAEPSLERSAPTAVL